MAPRRGPSKAAHSPTLHRQAAVKTLRDSLLLGPRPAAPRPPPSSPSPAIAQCRPGPVSQSQIQSKFNTHVSSSQSMTKTQKAATISHSGWVLEESRRIPNDSIDLQSVSKSVPPCTLGGGTVWPNCSRQASNLHAVPPGNPPSDTSAAIFDTVHAHQKRLVSLVTKLLCQQRFLPENTYGSSVHV